MVGLHTFFYFNIPLDHFSLVFLHQSNLIKQTTTIPCQQHLICLNYATSSTYPIVPSGQTSTWPTFILAFTCVVENKLGIPQQHGQGGVHMFLSYCTTVSSLVKVGSTLVINSYHCIVASFCLINNLPTNERPPLDLLAMKYNVRMHRDHGDKHSVISTLLFASHHWSTQTC